MGGLLAAAVTLLPPLLSGRADHIPWLFVGAAIAGGLAAGATVAKVGFGQDPA
jgi:hypothetical protein